jgi:ribosome-binding factor A
MGNRRDLRSGTRSGRSRHSIDPGAGIRALRLGELLREELSSILDGELGDRRFDGVVVSFVELSRDGSRARIWYSMKDNDATRVAEAEEAFGHAAGFFRMRLCDALPLKRFPELSFRHDPSALSQPAAQGER